MGRAAARGGSKCAAPLHPGARVGQAQCSFACRMRRERTCPDCEAIAHCRGSGSGYTRCIKHNGGPQPGNAGRERRRAADERRRPDAGDRGDRRAAGAGARDDRAAHHRAAGGGRADADRHPLGRARAAGRGAGAGEDPAGRDARHRARADRQPGAVHPGPDAGRHPRRRGAGDRRRRHPGVPLHRRADLLPAADGRRDQPRQPAHPVGALAGDAGEGGVGRRAAADPAEAVPRAGDAEPDRAGGHLSAARGAARPVPAADRRRLSRARPTSGRSSSRPPASTRRWPSRCSTPTA